MKFEEAGGCRSVIVSHGSFHMRPHYTYIYNILICVCNSWVVYGQFTQLEQFLSLVLYSLCILIQSYACIKDRSAWGTFVIGCDDFLMLLSLFKEICSCGSVIIDIEVILDTYYLCINVVFHFNISCKCAWSLSKCICFVVSLYYHSSYTSEKSMVPLEFHLFKINQNWKMHIAPLHNDHNTTRYVYHHPKMLLLLMLMMIWIYPSPWMSVANED